MKVVVTGGLGFLGRWLLAESGSLHELCLLSRRPTNPVIEFRSQIAACRQTDYSLEDLVQVLQGAEALVHLAAVRPAHGLPSQAYQANPELTGQLLQACQQTGIRRIILASTRAVYGKGNPSPWLEEQTPLPDSAYGESKLGMERLAEQFSLQTGVSVQCLRFSQLAGLGERGGFALTTFIENASRRKTLQVTSRGADCREYLYIRDAARAILSALACPLAGGAFNIGPQRSISILTLARLVNQVFENEGNLEVGPQAVKTGDAPWMDCRKARQQLGWQPAWTLEESLQEIRWMMENNRQEPPSPR